MSLNGVHGASNDVVVPNTRGTGKQIELTFDFEDVKEVH